MKSQNQNQFRWYDHGLLRIIPPLGALPVKLLMLTCRVVKVEGRDREEGALLRSGGSAIYAGWHQRMSYFAHYFGPRQLAIMISESRDGEYAARVASLLGFRSVRGSATRGGSRAIIQMCRRIRGGERSGILADGPQGPARVAKQGAVLIARNTGAPLIPVTWGADRCWLFNSWDRYMVPKPFARISVCFAEPIWIPASSRGQELEPYRLLLEERLNQASAWCDRQFGEERPWRKVTGEGIPETGPVSRI